MWADLWPATVIVDVELLLRRAARTGPSFCPHDDRHSPFGPVAAVAGARVAPTETRFKINHEAGSDTYRYR